MILYTFGKAVNLNYGIKRTTSKFARKSSSCAKKGGGDKKKDDEGSSENVASGDCNSESIYDCRKYGHNLPSNNVMTCFEPLFGIPSGVFRNTFGECLGPGADKCGCYKNPEYFSFHHMTFFDIHMYLRCCRNSSPVTGRKP